MIKKVQPFSLGTSFFVIKKKAHIHFLFLFRRHNDGAPQLRIKGLLINQDMIYNV